VLGITKFDAGDFKGAAAGLLRSLELKDDGDDWLFPSMLLRAKLFRYLARAQAGETPAAAELEVNSGRLKTKEWPYAVIEFYLGKRSLEQTLDAAATPAEKCAAQFYIGERYVLQNKAAEAQDALEKAAGTCPKDFLEYDSAQAELKRLKPANDFGDCDQTADADRTINGCTALLPGVYFNRGIAHAYKGEYDKAIADFNRAIALNPNSQSAYITRGGSYYAKGEVDNAIADYNRAIELNPNYSPAYSSRGYVYYYVMHEVDKAIADFNRAVELNPKNAITLRALGAAKFDAGDFKAAYGDLRRSLELKDDPYTMLFRYLALARAGETLAAAELELNSVRLKTKEWPYAVIEFYLGKRSLELTLNAAEKPTRKCEAQFYIGERYVLQYKSAEAQDALEKAAGTCPKDFLEYDSAQAELKRLKP
jgi:lipoprotein NlpI